VARPRIQGERPTEKLQVPNWDQAWLTPAVPGGEHARVLLPCVGELSARQFPNAQIVVGIGIGTEISLRACRLHQCDADDRSEGQCSQYGDSSLLVGFVRKAEAKPGRCRRSVGRNLRGGRRQRPARLPSDRQANPVRLISCRRRPTVLPFRANHDRSGHLSFMRFYLRRLLCSPRS
jgi:hypothetical protein